MGTEALSWAWSWDEERRSFCRETVKQQFRKAGLRESGERLGYGDCSVCSISRAPFISTAVSPKIFKSCAYKYLSLQNARLHLVSTNLSTNLFSAANLQFATAVFCFCCKKGGQYCNVKVNFAAAKIVSFLQQ